MIEGCGFGPCKDSLERGGAGCDLCDRVAKLPQPTRRHMVDADTSASTADHVETAGNVTRDGDPKLAAERKRGNLAFQKRHREGPVRQQRR